MNIIIGVCILFVIALLLVIFPVGSMHPESGLHSGVQGAANPYEYNSGDFPGTPLPKITATPVITPVIISSTLVSNPVTVSSTAVPTPSDPPSYVTIDAVPVPSPTLTRDITQDLPVPSTKDYFTIYSLNNQEATTTLPYVSFNLVNPPLVLEYTITPMNITDTKAVEYKILTTVYHETLIINRQYEQSWFKVAVRDRDTGRVVTENGFGREYSQETHGKIAIYKGGNYRFEFTGGNARVDLAMKVKKEGNIP